MHRLLCLLVLCACLAWGGRKSGPPDIVVSEVAVHREEGLISVTANVQNNGEKVLEGVQIMFRFEDDAGNVVSTQRATLDEKQFDPGAVSEINGQMKDSPRSVQMHVGAVTSSGRELRVGNDGPFPID